jgi:hypothetical protein
VTGFWYALLPAPDTLSCILWKKERSTGAAGDSNGAPRATGDLEGDPENTAAADGDRDTE